MTTSDQIDLAKIQQLVAGASNPRQKAMYQALLEKARQQQAQSPPPKPTSEHDASEQTVERTAIFQAIGVVKGEVYFTEEGKATVTLRGKEYPLLCASPKRRAYDAL